MQQRGRASAVMGLCLCLVALSGCRSEAGGAEAATEATRQGEAKAIDPALARNIPAGASAEEYERGRELFLVCATCHGVDGGGTQLGPSLRDGEWRIGDGSVEAIQQVIRQGVPEPEEFPVPMPAGGGGSFDAAELRALAVYVYATSRSGQPAAQPAGPPAAQPAPR